MIRLQQWRLAIAAAILVGCARAMTSTSGVPCSLVVSDSTNSTPVDKMPLTRSIVLPSLAHGRPTGHVTIHSFVNARGRVDSVRLEGTVSESFHLEIRRAAEAAKFRPAERDGCPVAAWADSMVMTFP